MSEAAIKQEPRLLKIASSLGPDVLILRRLQVREAISRPYQITAEVISSRADINPADMIGQPVTLTIAPREEAPRHFHGIVRAFGAVGRDERSLTVYRIEAAPRMWTLSLTADCKVFQDQPAKDIADGLLRECGQTVRFGTLPNAPRPYCVQYNETDLDFTQRLLDEMGCSYFFQQEAGDHTMVVAGSNADFPLLPGAPVTVRSDNQFLEGLAEWTPTAALQPSKVEAIDYDLLRPAQPLRKNSETVLPGTKNASWEVFNWPGGQHVRPEADPAKLGMQGYEAQAEVVTAVGADPRVFAGGRLRVEPKIGGSPQPWLVTAVVHDAHDDTHNVDGSGHGYSGALTLIPADRLFRPSAPRPRPVIPGLQSAVVVGLPGEEIYVDKHGRIKVQFLWDRLGKRDEKSSLWIRVAQPAAGKWGGTWFLPRIGDEVLVAFVDGDPDKPVVVGSLYNADASPPTQKGSNDGHADRGALPDHQTQTGFWSRSSKGGSNDTSNVLRFDDRKDNEEVYLQAQKDLHVLVKDARTETINMGQNDGDDTYLILKGDKKVEVREGDLVTEVGRGDDTLTLGMGDITRKADLGAVTVEAMQSITLKVGASKVVIDQTGVTIEGMKVTVKGTMMLTAEGMMTQIKGTAMLQASGGIVMIG